MAKGLLFLVALLTFACVSLSQNEKGYLPGTQEMDFPGEVVKNCFGIHKSTGCIIALQQGFGHINFRKSFINQSICIGNKIYEHGLGVHAYSSVLVKLPKPAMRFRAEVGFDNNIQNRGDSPNDMIFSVEAEGKIIWESRQINIDDGPVVADVPLNGVSEFYLKVRPVAQSVHHCHANWGNASVEYPDEEKVWLEEYANSIMTFYEIPFSFCLDGISSRIFFKDWEMSFRDSITPSRVFHHIKWVKPDKTFEVRCLLTEYKKYPAVEWKLFFKNSGIKDSPTLSDILSFVSGSQLGKLAVRLGKMESKVFKYSKIN